MCRTHMLAPHSLSLIQLLGHFFQRGGVPLSHVLDLGLVVFGLLIYGLL